MVTVFASQNHILKLESVGDKIITFGQMSLSDTLKEIADVLDSRYEKQKFNMDSFIKKDKTSGKYIYQIEMTWKESATENHKIVYEWLTY